MANKEFKDFTWDDIHCILCGSVEGTNGTAFPIGAEKEITLKNGETYKVQVAHGRQGELVLAFKDLYGKNENGGREINEKRPYDRDYAKSDMRKWLNGEFYNLLPDDLKKYIVPSGIQSGDDKLDDLIFIPSEVEVFGKKTYGDDAEGEQLDLYKDWHNRIAGYPDAEYGRYWWLRTKAGSGDFCGCSGNGYPSYGDASGTYGVRPHFCIK